MSLSTKKKLENSIKWEKKEVEKRVEQLLLSKAEAIALTQIEAAQAGHVQAGQYILDKLFGKAKQAVDIESGGQPIVFMPASLVTKFNLASPSPIEGEKIAEPNEYEAIS